MKFTKMQGLGNDYVYVNCLDGLPERAEELAVKISDRHFGVGSDGLILICSSDIADFKMVMYNADGSVSEMCGNGIRCVGKYVRDKGLTDKDEISVETGAGIKYLKFHRENGETKLITVDMGAPILNGLDIPTVFDKNPVVAEPIEMDGVTYKTTCVSMGNPHSVVFLDSDTDLKTFDIDGIGSKFESHPAFPRRVNAEFAKVIKPGLLEMRVYERGTGETLACGTGTCATHVAARLNGLTGDRSVVRLLGGELIIEWNGEGSVKMTGPAEFVFEGEYKWPE